MDSKAARKSGGWLSSPRETVSGVTLVAGCGPDRRNPRCALGRIVPCGCCDTPHLYWQATERSEGLYGEAMSMPSGWRRGFWGLLPSCFGYDWSTVLACPEATSGVLPRGLRHLRRVEGLLLRTSWRSEKYERGSGVCQMHRFTGTFISFIVRFNVCLPVVLYRDISPVEQAHVYRFS